MNTSKTPFPESFLHFIWEGMYFDTTHLTTTQGLPILLYKNGRLNTDQGPDFSQAYLQIGELEWWGNIEIHVGTEDWYKHQHHLDPLYNTTILHVVYRSSGQAVLREDGSEIPELDLSQRISEELWSRFSSLQLAQSAIPCEHLASGLPKMVWNAWLDRLAVERILSKAESMTLRLEQTAHNWNQVLWENLAGMMGGPVNKPAFQALAKHLPYSLLRKYANSPIALESLAMGLAGWLKKAPKKGMENPLHEDHYYYLLESEWSFLREKHQLKTPSPVPFHLHRMRPAAFPTLRVSQLLQLVHQYPQLTDLCLPQHLQSFLNLSVSASTYWDKHYFFFDSHSPKKKRMGSAQKMILLINVLIPFAWIYWKYHGRSHFEEELMEVMTHFPPEDNRITRKFSSLLGKPRDAFHSQGLIHLYKNFCVDKRCLDCAIGHQVLGKSQTLQKTASSKPLS